MSDELLGTNALRGSRIAVSVSDSPDLGRLGLLEPHLRLALGEIARSIMAAGGGLAYGGHLKPEGYTPFLVDETRRFEPYRQLLICLPWPVHRSTELAEILRFKDELGLFGRLVCLGLDGEEVDPSAGPRPRGVPSEEETRRGLTVMRRYLASVTVGRVLVGGKRSDFQGELPGLMEEALFALEARQPIYLAGGFGGVTADIIRALEITDEEWLPPTETARPDLRFLAGYERLRATGVRGAAGIRNGLDEAENQRLATTHRPSEVAALVSLGMGRVLADPGTGRNSGS